MKIFEILETDKIFEILKTNNGKARKPTKLIKPKKPSNDTIKPIQSIKSEPPLTPGKALIQSKKEKADRAKDEVKKERTVQKWNKEQRSD
jgi:hypothetical protein